MKIVTRIFAILLLAVCLLIPLIVVYTNFSTAADLALMLISTYVTFFVLFICLIVVSWATFQGMHIAELENPMALLWARFGIVMMIMLFFFFMSITEDASVTAVCSSVLASLGFFIVLWQWRIRHALKDIDVQEIKKKLRKKGYTSAEIRRVLYREDFYY